MTTQTHSTGAETHSLSLARMSLMAAVTSSMLALLGCGGAPGAPELELSIAASNSVINPESNVAKVATADCNSVSDFAPASVKDTPAITSAPADPSAAILAIESQGDVAAATHAYQRIAAELAGLRSAFPVVAAADAQPCYPSRLILWVDPNSSDTGRFDEYNKHLSARVEYFADDETTALVNVDGIFNMSWLAEKYENLPNIEFAAPDDVAFDGDDLCLETLPDDTHLYIVDSTDDDCASGCLSHEYNGFTVDTAGNMQHLGSYTSGAQQDIPEWFSNAQQCRNFL